MCTEHDTVVWVSIPRLDNNISGDNLAHNGVDVPVIKASARPNSSLCIAGDMNSRYPVDGLATLELLQDRLGPPEVYAKGGDVVLLGSSHCALEGPIFTVVDHRSNGTGATCQRGLLTKGAGTSANEGDVALDAGRKVFDGAPVILNQDNIPVDGLLVFGWRSQAHGRCRVSHFITKYQSILEDAAGVRREFLSDSLVVVIEADDGVADILQGPKVAFSSVSSCHGVQHAPSRYRGITTFTSNNAGGVIVLSPACVGNLVEILGTIKESVDGDGVLQCLAVDQGFVYQRRGCLGGGIEQGTLLWSCKSAMNEAS